MKISVIGSGYVGLVTGGCFADHGNQVYCVDSQPQKVKDLTAGKVPFFEPGLEDIVVRNLKEKRLHFTSDLASAVKNATIHFVCVGTPFVESIGTLDTRTLVEVAVEVAKHAKAQDLVVVKSTVPVGTAALIRRRLQETSNANVVVVSNPEFLKEGNAVEDFMKPDRVVVGMEDENGRAAKLMRELYSPFVRSGNPILLMDNNSAEMVKLASNGYLATRISYMNEIANLCESSGAMVNQVRLGMGLDQRIGHRYLYPGLGYGGSCFPKDIQALMQLGQKSPSGAKILTSVHHVNLQQRQLFLDKISKHFAGKLAGKTMAVWGLAFKPNTDDVRDAPSLDILAKLSEAGVKLRAYDPEAMGHIRQQFGDKVTLCDHAFDCLTAADALLILTEWGQFRTPDFDQLKSTMRTPVIFDGRNIFNPNDMAALGITYYFVGQPYGGPKPAVG